MIARRPDSWPSARRCPIGAGDRPLLISLVTETYGADVNGVAMTLGRLVGGLRDRGHRVELVRTRHPDEVRAAVPGADIIRPGRSFPGYREVRFGTPCTAMLRASWRRTPPDLVHIATEGPLGLSALSAARDCGIPVVTTFHTNFQTYTRHYRLGWLEPLVDGYLRWFHNRTRATLAPTRCLADELARRGYRGTGVMGRGIDTDLFSPRRRSGELRRAWGLGPDDTALLHVGRLAPEKNLLLAVRAFEELRGDRPDLKLVLVGDGPARAQVADRPGVVLCGYRRGTDLAVHYASADIFVFPSTTETYGNVLVEAMAAGLAVVGYDYAAAHERVVDGLNGVVAPFDDDEAFVAATRRLLTRSPSARRRLGAAARASVLALSWRAIVDTYVARVRPLVEAARTRKEGIVA